MKPEQRQKWLDILVGLTTILAAILLLAIVYFALSHVRRTVLVVLLAGVLAILLNPMVVRLERRMKRSLAVAIVVVGTLAVLSGLAFVLITPLIAQTQQLIKNIPEYLAQAEAAAPYWQDLAAQYGLHVDLQTFWANVIPRVEQSGTKILNSLVGIVTGIGNAVVVTVLVAVLAVYFLLDSPRLVRGLRRWLPAGTLEGFDRSRAIISEKMVSYVRAQLLLAAIIGLLAGVGSSLLGLPYSVLLGMVAGFFELIPMAGPVIGAIPAVILGLTISWTKALWVALYYVAINQLENHLLVPKISGDSVGLRPALAVIALFAGFELAGILGALFAVPLVGILGAILSALWGPKEAKRR
ncbi:MAG: AI-2E family transporter [Bacillota bacterium]|nr:AI-2E family transporter [Bacillota bacterium]